MKWYPVLYLNKKFISLRRHIVSFITRHISAKDTLHKGERLWIFFITENFKFMIYTLISGNRIIIRDNCIIVSLMRCQLSLSVLLKNTYRDFIWYLSPSYHIICETWSRVWRLCCEVEVVLPRHKPIPIATYILTTSFLYILLWKFLLQIAGKT